MHLGFVLAIRYPAYPQTKSSLNELELAVKEGEKRAYLLRLRSQTFFDQELSQCENLDEILQLTNKRELGIKIHDNGIKWNESKKAASYKIDDDFQGIPIEVELSYDDAAYHIECQNERSHKIEIDGHFASPEWYGRLVDDRLESLEDLADQLQDVLTDTSKIIKDVVKEIDLSNTSHLYEMAENSSWKTMLDFKGYVLPGNADPHQTCGTWRFSVCRDHNYGKRIKHSCNRLSCPTCVKKAGQRITKKIERRIWLYRLMIQKTTNNKRNSKPSHIIESIPANDKFWKFSKNKQQRILKDMRKIAGINAGVSIAHYWRFETGKTNPYVSIHNHLIAFGWVSPTAKQDCFEKYGVNVVYHKPAKGTLHHRKNVYSLGYYLLSHCAIKNHKHSVHWFGELSYRKIQNSYLKQFRDQTYLDEDIDIEKSKSCKLCGERLVPAKINKFFQNWHNFMPDPSDMEEGCMFPPGFLLEVDYMSEKMEFYTENYSMLHHKTKRELEEEKICNNPLLYQKKTYNSKILSFF